MARLLILSTLLLGLPARLALAQDPNAVTQRDIDQAIRKGAEHLKTNAPSTGGWLHANCDELILLTLIVAGVPESNPKFDEYLRHCLQAPLEKTYKVALLAMSLEELDADKYQMKIAQCAAFLVDNQATNGQWSYGAPVDVKNYPYVEKEQKVETGVKPGGARDFGGGGKEHKKPSKAIVVPQTKHQGDKGDNSNSQYAALGLRACFDAGVTLPESVIVLAVKWWRESQFKDPKKDKDKPAVASGSAVSGKVEGWNYKDENAQADKPPYHAMTAGGVGALVIYDYMLDRKWKDDSFVKGGMNWLTVHFDLQPWNTYYLYGIERAAILYGTEKIADHFWYAEGAAALIGSQKADGSWGKDTDWFNTTWDTCFSVLFLRRATRALVASEDKAKLKK
jgi:hypothetical protein